MPGDHVLAILPVMGSPFQTQFTGPFEVVEQVTNLNGMIATPGRRKSTQLHHFNLLKQYYGRSSVVFSDESELKSVLAADLTSSSVEEVEGV